MGAGEGAAGFGGEGGDRNGAGGGRSRLAEGGNLGGEDVVEDHEIVGLGGVVLLAFGFGQHSLEGGLQVGGGYVHVFAAQAVGQGGHGAAGEVVGELGEVGLVGAQGGDELGPELVRLPARKQEVAGRKGNGAAREGIQNPLLDHAQIAQAQKAEENEQVRRQKHYRHAVARPLKRVGQQHEHHQDSKPDFGLMDERQQPAAQ